MISSAFNAAVYNPLYNGLIYIVDILPSHDVGVAVIALTIIARIILFPLAKRAIATQQKMKKLAPELDALKEKYKNNREQQGKAMFALYKENDVHPFASFGLLLIQLPILFALYWIFAQGGLPEINLARLYSFVPQPAIVDMEFIGLINMAGKSFVLAVLAGATQIIYTRLSMGARKDIVPDGSFSKDMARSTDIMMRYALPMMVGGFAFMVPSAAALYWVASNTCMIAQELLMGRRFNDTEGISKKEAALMNFPSFH